MVNTKMSLCTRSQLCFFRTMDSDPQHERALKKPKIKLTTLNPQNTAEILLLHIYCGIHSLGNLPP